ncbi:MAG: helix-turn-helix domain-containing protein [Streptosporangiales bacterium]|nr:helix-turn-helix domain-containing protein [Streptosporangiales bacterium]
MGNPAETTGVQSVDRAVTIMEIMAREGDVGVTEIAAELGVHKSTAFRLVATLERRGLVEQDSDRGKYRLGVGLLRLAGATKKQLDLVQESRTVIEELAGVVGETVNITVLSEGAALYIDQVAGPSALQIHNWVGRRIPLHATSNGKALLAFHAYRRLSDLVRTPLDRFTEYTITSLRELEAALGEVRERGYAVAVNELELGLTAVAAPVYDSQGRVTASVSASGPGFRLEGRVEEVGKAVVDAGEAISRRLGWHPPRAV